MPIMRTLTSLGALLTVLVAWLLASAPIPGAVRILAAEMAPATITTPSGVPSPPPLHMPWRPLDQRALARSVLAALAFVGTGEPKG